MRCPLPRQTGEGRSSHARRSARARRGTPMPARRRQRGHHAVSDVARRDCATTVTAAGGPGVTPDLAGKGAWAGAREGVIGRLAGTRRAADRRARGGLEAPEGAGGGPSGQPVGGERLAAGPTARAAASTSGRRPDKFGTRKTGSERQVGAAETAEEIGWPARQLQWYAAARKLCATRDGERSRATCERGWGWGWGRGTDG